MFNIAHLANKTTARVTKWELQGKVSRRMSAQRARPCRVELTKPEAPKPEQLGAAPLFASVLQAPGPVG